MSKLRDFGSRCAWRIAKLRKIRPNRVVFCSYYGRGYSDSPKAICEVLRKSGEELELVWLCKDDDAVRSLPDGVRPVPYKGMKRLKALASAKVWVDNCRKYENVKRKGQFYLQTWHGFALKKIEKDAEATLTPDYLAACRTDSAQCDVIVSGSAFMSKLYRSSFWYDGAVLETGTPRNDVFYSEQPALHVKVCQQFGLDPARKLLLFAPTFRGDRSTDAYRIDAEAVRQAAAENLGGDWTVLIRLHPNVADQSAALYAYNGATLLDATAYPDMQELLCAADLLITDYSSSMFDYALTGKPIVQYAPDIEKYAGDRDFYFPIDQLPFPLARDGESLVKAVREVLPVWANNGWADFARENKFCEDGDASVKCAAIILQQIKKEKTK